MSVSEPIDPRQLERDEGLIERVRAGDTDAAPLLEAMRDNAWRYQ